MEYNTIIDIYDRLVDVSNKLHEDFDFDAHGFDKCLFVFQNALKRYEAINIHIENKNLRNKVEVLQHNFDSLLKIKLSTIEKNRLLISENNLLRQQLNCANNELSSIKNREIYKKTAGFNKVEIDFEGNLISFLIDTPSDAFDNNFKDATNYIYSKRKKKVDLSTIKNWYMEWYRTLGVRCIPA